MKPNKKFWFIDRIALPAGLGVALMWLVQAVSLFLAREAGPDPWRIFLGLWFTSYHSVQYLHLAGRPPEECGRPREFASDLGDCIALFLAFGAISVGLTDIPFVVIYMAVGLAGASAAIYHWSGASRLRRALIVLTIVVAVLVGVAHFLHKVVPHLDTFALVALWILLFVYLLRVQKRVDE
jgi:hypothetical protein